MRSTRPYHQFKPLFAITLLTLLIIFLFFSLWPSISVEPASALLLQDSKIKTLSPKCTNFPSKRLAQKPQLADGCYHVFLDIGANLGVHSRFLLEPKKYPEAKFARGIFDEDFGIWRDNRDICIFAFEPNPIHKDHFKEFTSAYRNMGWRVNFINAGVSDIAGNLTFYHMDTDPKWGKEVGFTSVQSKCKGKCVPETIPVVRLADWLEREILHRKLPDLTYGEYGGPKVLMKLDVEL